MTDTIRPIIFARYPVPGKCKTRLIPALGAGGAAAMHRRLAERTLDRLRSLNPVVAYTGADAAAFRDWLGPDIDLIEQTDGNLGARMLTAMAGGPAIIVGSDLPDISAHAVRSAAELLLASDVVLGPAEDGGFWLIGVNAPNAHLFEDVRWGGADVFARVKVNARRLGLDLATAAMLADLDRPEDVARWPDLSA